MPRYEIRNTSDNSLTYVEGTLPVDLMLTQAAGTYRAKVMSAEEATDIVVPTLTAGTIVQATPTVGDTLTVTGSNAPAGATFLWEVDTGSGFGAAGGTNNAASYDTTGRPAGDYRRGVSTAGQSMVYTTAVTVGAAGVTLTQMNSGAASAVGSEASGVTTFTLSGFVSGERVIIAYAGFETSTGPVVSGAIDPTGTNTPLTLRGQVDSSGARVALLDAVAGASGTLNVSLTGTTGAPSGAIFGWRTNATAQFKEIVTNTTNLGGNASITSTSGGEAFAVSAIANSSGRTWTSSANVGTIVNYTTNDTRSAAAGHSSDVASSITSVNMTASGAATASAFIVGVYE
jgi:hypothetical protein